MHLMLILLLFVYCIVCLSFQFICAIARLKYFILKLRNKLMMFLEWLKNKGNRNHFNLFFHLYSFNYDFFFCCCCYFHSSYCFRLLLSVLKALAPLLNGSFCPASCWPVLFARIYFNQITKNSNQQIQPQHQHSTKQ